MLLLVLEMLHMLPNFRAARGLGVAGNVGAYTTLSTPFDSSSLAPRSEAA